MSGAGQRLGTLGPWVGMVVIGTALWGVFTVLRPTTDDAIIVRADEVAVLQTSFERQHGRPPTEAETQALIDEYVDRRLLIREARARGLERGDPIVERRLVQKMGFVLEEQPAVADPGDEVLAAWMEQHPSRYRRPSDRRFEHVFVAGRTPQSEEEARRWAERLDAGESPQGQGEAFPHGPRHGPADEATIAERFGDDFAAVIMAAPLRRWVTAASSYGWHAVRVLEHRPGARRPLSSIRDRVLADWQQEQRAENRRRGLEALRREVQVVVP